MDPSKSKIVAMVCIFIPIPTTMVHLAGAKNELTDRLSHTDFDMKFGPKSQVESREAFSRMDTELDLPIKLFPNPIRLQNWFPEINLSPLGSLGAERTANDKKAEYKWIDHQMQLEHLHVGWQELIGEIYELMDGKQRNERNKILAALQYVLEQQGK